MRYHARFIGGPIDGQERVLNKWPPSIEVGIMVYMRLCVVNHIVVYSIYSFEETLERVWNHYTGEKS
jgi:hypothetical protein